MSKLDSFKIPDPEDDLLGFVSGVRDLAERLNLGLLSKSLSKAPIGFGSPPTENYYELYYAMSYPPKIEVEKLPGPVRLEFVRVIKKLEHALFSRDKSFEAVACSNSRDPKGGIKVYECKGMLAGINSIKPSYGGEKYKLKVCLDDEATVFEPFEPCEQFLQVKEKLGIRSRFPVGVGREAFYRMGRAGDRVIVKYIKFSNENLLLDIIWEDGRCMPGRY